MVSEVEQKGADAVLRIDVDYEFIQLGQGGSMLIVRPPGPLSSCSESLIAPQDVCPAVRGGSSRA
jgi:hypothetical protein